MRIKYEFVLFLRYFSRHIACILDFFKFFKKFNNINPREEINFFSTIIVFTITNQAIIPL